MTSRALRFALLAPALLAGALLAGCGGPKTSSPTEQSNAVQDFLLREHLDGQAVLFEFANVDMDCANSRAGLDAMIRMNRDKVVPGLSYARVEGSADDAKVAQYYQVKPAGFPVIRDKNGAVTRTFEAMAIPTFALVDRFGRIRYRGSLPEDAKLTEWVNELQQQTTDIGAYAPMFGAVTTQPSTLLAETSLPDTLLGRTIPLTNYKGASGLVVVFADVSCPFANAALGEMPTVVAVLAPLGINGVVVNIGDDAEDVKNTYAQRNTGTPVVYDVTDAAQQRWGVTSVPTVVFINAEGQVAYRGPAVWKDLGAAVEKATGKPAGSVTFTVEGTGMG